MKNSSKNKIIILVMVSSVVIISGFSFAKLHHEDISNQITYTLSDISGNIITEQGYDGRWSLVTFGFTHCPDVCPLQASTMATTLEHLDSRGLGDSIVPVFISVDYMRDSPETVQAYVNHFDNRFIGLTGTQAQLDLTVDAFQTHYEVINDTNQGSVDVIHSSMLYLVDPSGRMMKQFSHGVSATDLADNLGAYL
jgi:protein SCO1/2